MSGKHEILADMAQAVLDLNVSSFLLDLVENKPDGCKADAQVMRGTRSFVTSLLVQRVSEVTYCCGELNHLSENCIF